LKLESSGEEKLSGINGWGFYALIVGIFRGVGALFPSANAEAVQTTELGSVQWQFMIPTLEANFDAYAPVLVVMLPGRASSCWSMTTTPLLEPNRFAAINPSSRFK
jgi:hypothetical protein